MYFSAAALILLLALPINARSSGHALSRLPRHHDLSERLAVRAVDPAPSKKIRRRRTCRAPTNSTSTTSSTPASSTVQLPTSSKTTSTSTSTTNASSAPSSNTGNILGVAFKPVDWPTATQAGAAPSATVTSAADPLLKELSKSYNNKVNDYYTSVHTGDMTYYDTGLGACGDTYDDSSYTAAVSHLMYDAWPGASEETNRNPICGPYVPGRKTISSSGSFVTALTSSAGFVNIGGDGLLNCATTSQCHIPLTATVQHGGKSIIVNIVDRCVGCEEGDIDLTPTAFAALADMSLGRTDVTWWFNQY